MSLSRHRDRRDLLSFPTRRSSDLETSGKEQGDGAEMERPRSDERTALAEADGERLQALRPVDLEVDRAQSLQRSEEHTSELQSRVDLVCRLLLEKKKLNIRHITAR